MLYIKEERQFIISHLRGGVGGAGCIFYEDYLFLGIDVFRFFTSSTTPAPHNYTLAIKKLLNFRLSFLFKTKMNDNEDKQWL